MSILILCIIGVVALVAWWNAPDPVFPERGFHPFPQDPDDRE